jgi:hypothetical protein
VQDTFVVPTGKVEPEAGVQVITGEAVQLSLDVAEGYVTTAPPGLFVVTCWPAGQVMLGASSSTTVTGKDAEAPPVVEQLTVVVPRGKVEPEGGVQLMVTAQPVGTLGGGE